MLENVLCLGDDEERNGTVDYILGRCMIVNIEYPEN
jgi:hypothetical protein